MDRAWAIVLAVLPSGVCGFLFWLIEHRISKREEADKQERLQRQKEMDKREDARQKFELTILSLSSATYTLAEATARAVQRIPEAHCNGDMTKALAEADEMKKKQEKFLHEQAIDHLN